MKRSEAQPICEESATGTRRDERRVVLPIPERAHSVTPILDAHDPDNEFPPIEPVRPPKAAPNVLVVLLDEVGFGASTPFGGQVNTPTADRLAGGGLSYTRFHTTALCAPTRAALLTGRNHHTVNMGAITELATSAPGQTSVGPQDCAPLAETLRLNGYSTAPGVFSADETADVGTDAATGVTDDLDKSNSTFNGEVNWVQIDLGDAAEDFDHMVTADERYRIAMSRQ